MWPKAESFVTNHTAWGVWLGRWAEKPGFHSSGLTLDIREAPWRISASGITVFEVFSSFTKKKSAQFLTSDQFSNLTKTNTKSTKHHRCGKSNKKSEDWFTMIRLTFKISFQIQNPSLSSKDTFFHERPGLRAIGHGRGDPRAPRCLEVGLQASRLTKRWV